MIHFLYNSLVGSSGALRPISRDIRSEEYTIHHHKERGKCLQSNFIEQAWAVWHT